MWVEKTKKGYRMVERYKDPMTGRTKKASVSMEKNTSASRKGAERALMEKIKGFMHQKPDSSDITVKDIVEAWQEQKKAEVKASTFKAYQTRGSLVIRLLGSETLSDSLSAPYINKILTKNYKSAKSRNNTLQRIKEMLRWAYANDLISDIAWIEKLTSWKDSEDKQDSFDKYLERDDLVKLLEGIEVDKWRQLTSFLALTGLRIGEALALTYKDIDLQQRLIHVDKTYNQFIKETLSAKTGTSNRDIYIQDELLPLCEKLYKNASMNRFVSDLIFPDATYLSYHHYLDKRSMEILGRKITPHYLRHTHVALLAEQGISLDVISRRLGHKDSNITKEVYFHVTNKLKEKDYEAVRNVAFF